MAEKSSGLVGWDAGSPTWLPLALATVGVLSVIGAVLAFLRAGEMRRARLGRIVRR